jgi:macrolide-specific efflux system membrane fusion protein
MNKRAVAIGGVLVVGIAMVGLVTIGQSLGDQTPDVTYLTATASVADVRDTVSVSGSVRSVDSYGLAFGQEPDRSPKAAATTDSSVAPSWTVLTVDVAAGQAVKAGAILATADTGDAQVALIVAQANLAAAQARLEASEQPVTRTARAKARLGIKQAKSQLSQAQKTLAQTQASGRLAISQASAALDEARQRRKDDRAAGALRSVIDADTAAVKQAKRALATAERQAASANTQASGQVAAARLGVQSAELAFDTAVDVDTDAAVAADQAAVAQAKSAVSDAERTLELATLIAPIDGVISSVTIEPGDQVSGTVVLLRGTAVEVAASITESNLPAVAIGQPAEVSLPALDVTVVGAVHLVDLAGATKSASGVVSYGIVISLATPPDGVAPSMTADVDITTASAEGVLAVPVTAIGGEPGAYTVQVLDAPDRVRTVPVEVGLLTASLAEIRSGIDAGTVVVTGTATARDLVTTFPTGPGGGSGGGGAGTGGGSSSGSPRP